MLFRDLYPKPPIPKNMNNEESRRVARLLNRYYEAELALARLNIEIAKQGK